MSLTKRFLMLLPFVAALPLVAPAQAPPEFRAAWVSRFNWAYNPTTEAALRPRIATIMQTLADNNFNAVLFQIRGECNTLYPSPYEPWGPQFSWTDPGWDPLEYAIEQAKLNGLEFHAYINTHTMASTIPPATTTPQHLYNLHGPAAEESWVIHNTSGEPVAQTDSYVWLSPGVPQAEAWTRRAIMHVVENYDVDGIHFDRIRTPGAGYSYDPITVARFNSDGNPDGEEWGDFMRSQISRQLRRIYGQTMLVKPHVKVSAAPFGICMRVPGGYQGTGTESYYAWYQDSFGWMQNHILDCIFPMIYWDIGSAHPFEVLLADFLARDGGRHIYAGMVTSRDYIAQIYESRSQGAPGHVIFSYGSVDFNAYITGPYTEPAPIPEMPWKTNRPIAHIAGKVLGPDMQPVTDARINITGDSYNYLSSADGVYAILNIPAGTVTVTANKGLFVPAQETLTVAAGDIIELDLILGGGPAEFDSNRPDYLPGQSIHVTVTDYNLPNDFEPVVVAESTETGDSQIIPLTDAGGGDYTGTIQTSLEPGVAGTVHVERNDTLTLSYDMDQADDTKSNGENVVTLETTIQPWQVIDNDEPGFDFTGDWGTSTFGNNYGINKRYATRGDGSGVATWQYDDIPAGHYDIHFWVNHATYAEDARYLIHHDAAPAQGELVIASQYNAGDGWHPLGTHAFSGGDARIDLVDTWDGNGNFVVADALRITMSEDASVQEMWYFF